MATPTPPSVMEDIQAFARHTFMGGALGACLGGTLAFVRRQPIAFYVSAFGVNSAIFCGSFLGVRAGYLYFLRPNITAYSDMDEVKVLTRDMERVASVLSGATVGAILPSMFGGGPRMLLNAAVWGSAALAGELALDKFEAWRSSKAAEIVERNDLWAKLSSEQQAHFVHYALAARSKALAPPTERASLATLTQIEIPPVSSLPLLRQFAIQQGVVSAPVAVESTEDEAPISRWAWVPVHMGTADAFRQKRLRARLAEIDAILGNPPAASEEQMR